MKKHASILVTGATGLLGRNLRALLEKSCPEATIVGAGPSSTGDLSDRRNWLELGGPFDLVFHLAAKLPAPDVSGPDLYRLNTAMSIACLESCEAWGTTSLVYSSSIAVYPMGAAPTLHEGLQPRPTDFYGASKLAGEHLLSLIASATTTVVNLRFSSIYGPGPSPALSSTVLYAMVQAVRQGRYPKVHGNGTRTQDFLHVADAARACLLASESGDSGTFNIGSGAATSMLELAQTVLAVHGKPNQRVAFVPNAPEGESVALDVSKARTELNFAPRVDIESGLRSLA
jgi:UDP-glucose 4-epimerase